MECLKGSNSFVPSLLETIKTMINTTDSDQRVTSAVSNCFVFVFFCDFLAVQTIEFDEGAGAVLRIQPLRAPRDENTYECVARNSEGEVSVTAKLAIIRGEAHTSPILRNSFAPEPGRYLHFLRPPLVDVTAERLQCSALQTAVGDRLLLFIVALQCDRA